jgi:hypothetical protein
MVRCVRLRGEPIATIGLEECWVNLGKDTCERPLVKILAFPLRYADILTVYSAQGSQFPKVHVHAEKFKGKRNLLYTAVTRAMEAVKITGITNDVDLRTKMELHPKSVLWQHEHGQSFPLERVQAAQREVGLQ